jgi:hypothetical protein
MAKRKKKRSPDCLFCQNDPETVGTILFSTAPSGEADGICDHCVRVIFRKLCDMNLLSILDTNRMTRH